MARSKNGQAVGACRKTPEALEELQALFDQATAQRDLAVWRRAKAVMGSIAGRKVCALAAEVGVTRGAGNRWLQWYQTIGAEGLRTGKASGAAPRLTPAQREELGVLIDAGTLASGLRTGIWTGPKIGDLIHRRFGASYHNHYIPPLLHQIGSSLQRPRKRLARADAEAQEAWLRDQLPATTKKPPACRGVVIFEDEVSFWVDGTLHQTWSRVGVQPQVDTSTGVVG